MKVSIKVRARKVTKRDRTSVKEAMVSIRERIKDRSLYGFKFGEDNSPFDLMLDNSKTTLRLALKWSVPSSTFYVKRASYNKEWSIGLQGRSEHGLYNITSPLIKYKPREEVYGGMKNRSASKRA